MSRFKYKSFKPSLIPIPKQVCGAVGFFQFAGKWLKIGLSRHKDVCPPRVSLLKGLSRK